MLIYNCDIQVDFSVSQRRVVKKLTFYFKKQKTILTKYFHTGVTDLNCLTVSYNKIII